MFSLYTALRSLVSGEEYGLNRVSVAAVLRQEGKDFTVVKILEGLSQEPPAASLELTVPVVR